METKRVQLRQGVWLTYIKEEKFKTACFSVSLLAQLNRDTASMNALIPYVLKRGTSTSPDLRAIQERFDNLYGTSVDPLVFKCGEIQTTGFYASFPEDDYLPEGADVLRGALGLTMELLLSPATRGGLLMPGYVESERENLADQIAARVNNKRTYAVFRCMEEMCRFEDYSIGRYGDEEGCRSIGYRKLTRQYKELLQHAPIEMFYCGRASFRKIIGILSDLTATLPRGEIDDEIGTDIRMNAVEENPRFTEEFMDVAQTNLVIGWRMGECMEEPDIPALYVFNALFGGSPNSRLFQHVRERLHLCYYASSILDQIKGLLLVSAGIQRQNYELARDEIFTQLRLIAEGQISDVELGAAIASVVSDMRSIPDSQAAIESFCLTQMIRGLDFGPDELAELVQEVTAEQVARIAQSVVCDQIYLLSPEEEEETDECSADEEIADECNSEGDNTAVKEAVEAP